MKNKTVRECSQEIGLCGYPRSGKDTLFQVLDAFEPEMWNRVAFADAMKKLAVEIEPRWGSVACLEQSKAGDFGKWDQKEVREYLQRLGQSIRNIQDDFWILATLPTIYDIPSGQGVVFTDVRYPNEAEFIEGPLVAIVRPGYDSVNDHQSEKTTEYLIRNADFVILNDGEPEDMYHKLLDCLSEWE